MAEQWRRIGWQQMQLVVPMDWYLTKISTDRTAGELWLADGALPRVQIKWHDAARKKAVDCDATLSEYLKQIERQAKKRGVACRIERGVQLVGRRGRAVSSLEGFHWSAEMDVYGVIWYSPEAQRVTLAQVNGLPTEKDLKETARRVLGSLRDAPEGEADLWTAYDLECRVPTDFSLAAQRMETGHTELKFARGKETVTITRLGLAEIALQRAGNLGDLVWRRRYKEWSAFDLERTEEEWRGLPAVTFGGRRRGWLETLRLTTYSFFKVPYPIWLDARAWHCPQANCIYLVEHFREQRATALLAQLCEAIPCTPTPVA